MKSKVLKILMWTLIYYLLIMFVLWLNNPWATEAGDAKSSSGFVYQKF